MVERPSGTVTFLFTDIEGSTRLWEEQPDEMRRALGGHDRVSRAVFATHGGYVFSTGGDGFGVAFGRAGDALAAARALQATLADEAMLKVRMGIHTGEVDERDDDYFGPAVNRAARIMAAGHGGQILISATTAGLLDDPTLVDLGWHRLRDVATAVHLHQVGGGRFPALRTVDAVPTNLPVPVDDIVGRDTEIAALVADLRAHRVVTVTGVGGVGKTRLAIHTAARVVDTYPHGTWFVELASVSGRDAVAGAVAAVLGVHQRPGMNGTVRSTRSSNGPTTCSTNGHGGSSPACRCSPARSHSTPPARSPPTPTTMRSTSSPSSPRSCRSHCSRRCTRTERSATACSRRSGSSGPSTSTPSTTPTPCAPDTPPGGEISPTPPRSPCADPTKPRGRPASGRPSTTCAPPSTGPRRPATSTSSCASPPPAAATAGDDQPVAPLTLASRAVELAGAPEHERFPWVAGWAAYDAYLTGKVDTVRTLVRQAEAAAARTGGPINSWLYGTLAELGLQIGDASLSGLFDRAVATARQAGPAVDVAMQTGAAWKAQEATGRPASTGLADEVMQLARATGNPSAVAVTLHDVALARDLPDAAAALDEALALAVQADNTTATAAILGSSAHVAVRAGHARTALARAVRGLRLLDQAGNRNDVTFLVGAIVQALMALGHDDEAAVLSGAVLHGPHRYWWTERRDATLAELRRRLGDDRYHTLAAHGRDLSYDALITRATDVAAIEDTTASAGQHP